MATSAHKSRLVGFRNAFKLAAITLVWLMVPTSTDAQGLTIWANNGEDKITQDELRASANPPTVVNSVWDGTSVKLFGGRNETVSFCLILESPDQVTTGISVALNQLTGPNGAVIRSVESTGNGVFNWIDRPIELFYVRYLTIKGIGRLLYDSYDERHIPERLRRPFTGEGQALPGTGWTDRPDHDRNYPDIAVPLELESPFRIAANQNQCVWVDVYIPKSTPVGRFSGQLSVDSDQFATRSIPVELRVRNFTLPDAASLKTMAYVGYSDINRRYVDRDTPYPNDAADLALSKRVIDRHFQLARRHRISLIGAEGDGVDRPHVNWDSRLDGSLFSANNGYAGPGVSLPNEIYSIGTYGSWGWADEGEAGMRRHSNAWVNWFDTNAPLSDYFLYLIDESSDYPAIERWSNWLSSNPGPGRRLRSFATLSIESATENTPALRMPCAAGYRNTADVVQQAANEILQDPDKTLCFYNGQRPISGTFATEDDGVALRTVAWSQFKKRIQRWFYWESTYYNNFQGGTGETDVFASAHTFGGRGGFDNVFGETGWNYSNGDGVLFYPGTDKVFPNNNYNVEGPIASLRLKHWRRGIQDGDYLSLARAINPTAVNRIVERLLPKSLWEYGVTEPSDPTYVLTDISWSTDPDVWEAARAELADIIDDGDNASPHCGRPDIQRATERDIFVWRNCPTNTWTVATSAGANRPNGDRIFSHFKGAIQSDQPVSNLEEIANTLESGDNIAINGGNRVDFSLRMASGYNAIDSFRFQARADAQLCLDLTEFGGDRRVLIGAGKQVHSGFPLDIQTLRACPDVTPPSIACGSPNIDRATDRGLFLWLRCGSNQWEVTAVGGTNDGNGNRVYSAWYGALESAGGMANVQGLRLEAGDDSVDAGANQFDYVLKSASGFGGIDTIRFETPASTSLCLRQRAPSRPNVVYVGRNRERVTRFPHAIGPTNICG